MSTTTACKPICKCLEEVVTFKKKSRKISFQFEEKNEESLICQFNGFFKTIQINLKKLLFCLIDFQGCLSKPLQIKVIVIQHFVS